MFACVLCKERIVSDFCPAIDYRTDGAICEPCREEQNEARWNPTFEEDVRMSELDAREVW